MKKRKILIPVLAALLCIGMIGVGYAAWVITTDTSADVQDANNFVVYDVENRSVNFQSTFTDKSVTFGSKTFDTAEGTITNHGWLTLTDGDNNEDLNATLQITITNWDVVSAAGNTVTITLSSIDVINSSKVAVSASEYEKYIVLPYDGTGIDITIKDGVLDATSKDAGIDLTTDGVLTIPFNFAWGEAFGGENPNQFFNSVASGTVLPNTNPCYKAGDCDTYLELAEKALGALYNINSYSYRVSVTASLTVSGS